MTRKLDGTYGDYSDLANRIRGINNAQYFIHGRGKAIREIGDSDRASSCV